MTKIRDFELVSKYIDKIENFKMPKRATKFSAGYDIFNNTGEDIVIIAGEASKAISTNLKAYMLTDEYLSLHVRSGHGFKFFLKLANTVGIIDNDYYNNASNEGEIFVKFINQGWNDIRITPGEAMAQAIFSKYLITDSDSSETDRIGGFGSTT